MNVFAEANVIAVHTIERVDRRRLDIASELLKTLAAPIRLAVLVELGSGPRCVHELVDALQASQPLVSQHLRVLRAARLVAAERRGREVVYRLADEHVGQIVQQAIRHTGEARP
jgi:DNA-binding transcriptional ArsR family regulator